MTGNEVNERLKTISKNILWPFSNRFSSEEYHIWWLILSALLVIPFTAVIHHAIFYRANCMLNPFGGADYFPSAIYAWLSRDPSLPWAIVAAISAYFLGKRYRTIKLLAAPIFISFLPVSLWIWDIPFTGRFICDQFHDDKLLILGNPMKTRYLYLLGVTIYASFFIRMMLGRNTASSGGPG